MQISLFDVGLARPEPPAVDHQGRARARIARLIEKLRAATTMPLSPSDARMWKTVLPQMAGWLPPAEAADVQVQFAYEMARLEYDDAHPNR